ncbi:MAG: hypothetical protein GY866_20125 [Proteobacteria bacterium]|nr:hypothetical protein [Pseudomonadota bacterium]
MIDYLDLVEEYKEESPISLFDKVKVMSSRARDLYAGKTSKIAATLEGSKPVSVAQYEYLKGLIEPDIYTKDEKVDGYQDDLDLD